MQLAREDPRPARSGRPWTDEDYARLVELVRSGASEETIAADLGRAPNAVAYRVKRMLPVAEQGCVTDRGLPALRGHLADQMEGRGLWQHLVERHAARLRCRAGQPLTCAEAQDDAWQLFDLLRDRAHRPWRDDPWPHGASPSGAGWPGAGWPGA